MKQFLFFSILLACLAPAFGQTGKMTGWVQDAETRVPLELATVTILGQDSSLVSYQLSNKDGLFNFDKLPLQKKLLVTVSYTGYMPYNSSLELKPGKTDTLAVYLSLSLADTNAIVVTATAPIRMNGDTLELNPAAFKMKPDAVVEEMLNEVAGITIWSDGTITVNGRKVQNLLVDGKPFLGSTDTRVATQNLPKAAIDKIQLYQEFDRSNIGRESQPQDSLLTMNIKLKESSKKGYFGKAGAGYGTNNRFESDLSFQMYNKKSSAGIGGGFNNINKNIGNLQEMFQNNTYRNYNPNLYGVGRFGSQGISRNYSIGGVVTHNFIESANSRQNDRLTVNYNATGADTYITSLTLQNRTTGDNPQFIKDEGVENNRRDGHSLGVNYVKTNSYNDNLHINGSANTNNTSGNFTRYTEVRDSVNNLQSTNRQATIQNGRSDGESLSVNFAKSDRDDPLKNFNLQVNGNRNNNVGDREVTSEFQSLTDSRQNRTFNRRYNNRNESITIGGNIDYAGFKRLLFGRYNLFGINVNFMQLINYSRMSDNAVVTDYDSSAKVYKRNLNLSNYNRRELLEYSPTLSLSKSFFKGAEKFYRSFSAQVRVIEDVKTEKNLSSITKRTVNRSFQFLRYEGSLGFQRQQREKYQYYFSLNYNKSFQYPSINQLYTIVDDINAYEIRVGNPDLRNTIYHRLGINGNFGTQNPKSPFSLNGGLNGSLSQGINPVTDSVINETSGRRISYFVNGDENRSLNLGYNINISRRIKKSSLQLMYNGSFNTSENPNFVDRIANISKTANLSNQFTLQFSLRSLLIVNVGKSFQYFRSRQTAAALTPFTNNNNTTKYGLVLNYPTNFTLSSTLDHVANSNLAKPIVLWNAFATYRFMKQQGELKASAMDLLKQYQNITNSANAYGTTTSITNGLQQYFLLTFSYYPRKFGKTAIKQQTQTAVGY